MPIRLFVEASIPDCVDCNTACVQLHIGMAALYRWIKQGRIVSVMLGGRRLIPASEISRMSRLRLLPERKEATDSS